MTRRIFKYQLKVEPYQAIMMPKNAEVLHVGVQNDLPYVWVAVDPTQPMEPKGFRMVTTGAPHTADRLWHIGTVEIGGWFVAHYFTIEEALPASEHDVEEARFQDDVDQMRADIKARELADESETYESGELVPPHRRVPA